MSGLGRSRLPLVAGLLLLVLLTASCGSSRREDPILRLSATEALDQGKLLMADKKYAQARKYLIHAFEVEPNSAAGREGLLLAADALFLAGGNDNLIEAETRYRDFLNRFPTSEQAAYAQFQIGRALAARMEKPNRDQTTTRKSLAAFEDLLRLYPTSAYAAEARAEMERVRINLAEHEYRVGAFYVRYGCRKKGSRLCLSAADRFQVILDDFPSYPEPDKVLYQLCRIYTRIPRPEDRRDACTLLQTEYPDSRWRDKAAKLEPRALEAGGTPDEESSQSAPDLAADGGL